MTRQLLRDPKTSHRSDATRDNYDVNILEKKFESIGNDGIMTYGRMEFWEGSFGKRRGGVCHASYPK